MTEQKFQLMTTIRETDFRGRAQPDKIKPKEERQIRQINTLERNITESRDYGYHSECLQFNPKLLD